MKKILNLISKLPEGSEKDYHLHLYNIIGDFDVNTDKKELGLALMFFLDRYDVIAGEFNTITHPASGSTYENARFVSYLFDESKLDTVQWKTEFLKINDDTFLKEFIDWWKTQFQNSSKVDKVIA